MSAERSNSERLNTDLVSAPTCATSEGRWITPAVSYVDPARRFCDLCGRPIARRFWQVDSDGGEGVFCDPGHAQLYTTYPKSSGATGVSD